MAKDKKDNQQKFRITGHLIEGAESLQEKKSLKELNDVYRTALRLILLSPELSNAVEQIAAEDLSVQAIMDEMILEQLKSGVSLKDLAHKAWVEAKLVEARARAGNQGDRFFIVVDANRKLGPHRLDLIRQWIAQDVIQEDWLIHPEKGKKTVPIGFYPDFFEFPADVLARVEAVNKKKMAEPIEPASKKQIAKLEFFGLPYPREALNKARASEILDVWMAMDPETELRYQREKLE